MLALALANFSTELNSLTGPSLLCFPREVLYRESSFCGVPQGSIPGPIFFYFEKRFSCWIILPIEIPKKFPGSSSLDMVLLKSHHFFQLFCWCYPIFLFAFFPSLFVPSNPMLFCSFSLGEDELEISPYDDTLMDTRMASLVAGKT